ncbi:ABC transporter substrate-binding protein [Mycolicibacterium agri]|uniref:ABC transporter substrate-binding protein n=1 Tax=Mycolicibacterium agri TaxID=36811 RepID=A0A2A7N0B4_MYCAG|nr:amino acid ABC transporter substrate-binding protein [Mycolicibacterium agri]PEG37354.1 ABC transporter substrate-binding protein [Mycolicibacterium agri]GFG52389.1 ABC transporter substrate-binding protein [Mycolicibacterium agri]
MSSNINRRVFLTRAGLVMGGAMAAPSLLAACGGGGGGGGGATDTFKVGAVLELSGESATGGQIAQRGYQLWADTVNDKGGLSIGDQKYNVELIVQDCKSDPATGADATSRLVTEEGVNAIFGAYTSGVQIAMDPICTKYRVPCIAGSAESPNIWKSKPEFTFGVIPAVDTTAARSIQSIVEVANPKPVSAAVVGANEPFSDNTAEGFRQGVQDAGLNLVHYGLFPTNADLAPVAGAVAAQRPDIVAVGGHDVLLVDFVKAMAATGYTPKAIIEHYGITDASFAQALGRQADGVLGISVWLPTAAFSDDLFGSAADYAKAFEDKYGTAPDYTAAGCSAAGQVLQAAVEKLGEPPSLSEESRGKLNELIAQTDLQSFYGPIKFATDGDHFHNNTALDPMLVQIQGGQVKAIAPPDAAEAKIIYPLPPLT